MSARPPWFDAELVALRPKLTRFCRRICANRYLADDIVQSTIVKMLEHWEKFAAGTNFAGWALTIARNEHFNHLRRSKRIDYVDEIPIVATPANQDRAVLVLEIATAFGHLTVDFQRSLLAAGDGLSVEEAASEASIAIGTSKSRLSRARAALMEAVGEAP